MPSIAESHEKIRLVGMQRDRPYIPARSIGSEQKRIGVSGTIASRARAVCVCVGNGGPQRWCVLVLDNGGGKSGGG